MGSSPSAQQEAVMMFDSYCKTVIMNCARRYWKREAKRSEHEYLVTDEQLAGHPANKDDFLEQYIITCGNIQAVFHCFALFTAIEQLKEKEKTVVVLKYWGGYTDKYYPVDRMMHDIALALMAVQTQTTEILDEFPTKAAKTEEAETLQS